MHLYSCKKSFLNKSNKGSLAHETIIEQQRSAIKHPKCYPTYKKGGMIIMVDDKDRENEGDIVLAAQHVDAQKSILWPKKRGLICLSMEESFIHRLQLPMMLDHNKPNTPLNTAFTVSIEAREGVQGFLH